MRIGRGQLRTMLDVYNLFNANTVKGINASYGTAWLRPTEIMGTRLFKVGAQFDF